jgi:hypothetical protein
MSVGHSLSFCWIHDMDTESYKERVITVKTVKLLQLASGGWTHKTRSFLVGTHLGRILIDVNDYIYYCSYDSTTHKIFLKLYRIWIFTPCVTQHAIAIISFLPHFYWGVSTFSTAAVILCFSSCNGAGYGGWNIWSFVKLHKKKSRGVRSGDHGAQEIGRVGVPSIVKEWSHYENCEYCVSNEAEHHLVAKVPLWVGHQ